MKQWARDWLWDWKVAKPYFIIAGIGALIELTEEILSKL